MASATPRAWTWLCRSKLVGRGGVELFIGNGLLNQHQASNHYTIDEEYFAALEQ